MYTTKETRESSRPDEIVNQSLYTFPVKASSLLRYTKYASTTLCNTDSTQKLTDLTARARESSALCLTQPQLNTIPTPFAVCSRSSLYLVLLSFAGLINQLAEVTGSPLIGLHAVYLLCTVVSSSRNQGEVDNDRHADATTDWLQCGRK